ncbi:hypothetical protein D3C71_1874970 [compost metagenome]
MVGNDDAARWLIEQRADVGANVQAQDPGRRPAIEARKHTAVVRMERTAQTDQHTQYANQHKVQSQ